MLTPPQLAAGMIQERQSIRPDLEFHSTVEENSCWPEVLIPPRLSRGQLLGLVCLEEPFVFEYYCVLDELMGQVIRIHCSSWR